ncbi:hypothetical protein PHMEG_00029809 [Phytophthora megakarya]|uniref:RxLR effector protein n=1 Tax=Phytophthora megakarya TaxID=4795 RepID=A0A225V091_9STRA|nr:hypothetical protein PHMEG_00029809 [Phytophthora megakarya]
MSKWTFIVVIWVAMFSSISAGKDRRMLRGAVIVHKANSSSGDQELISPANLTHTVSKLKSSRRCFRSLFEAEKCIILAITPK